MYLECIKDVKEYDIYKGSLWKVIETFPKNYYIEIKNCNGNIFMITPKYSFNFKFLG